MASFNPFDLLGDNDNDDPALLVANLPAVVPAPAQATKKPAPAATKPQSKPLLPAQPVQEGKFDGQRGGGRFGGRFGGRGNGRGNGRGPRGYNRDSSENESVNGLSSNGVNGGYADGDGVGERPEKREFTFTANRYHPGRRGSFTLDGESERPKRVFERRSGTGRGNEFKREGSGRGNWGNPTDVVAVEPEEPVVEAEKNEEPEKPDGQQGAVDATKEIPPVETEKKEPEEKEMTLEEYEKVLEEKRQALQAQKTEERKVVMDKDLAKMQLLSNKKSEEEIFAKLGSEKEKLKEAAEKEEKARKSLSISEFLKPAEGERNRNLGGRGRGRGRGPRGGYGGGGVNRMSNVPAPAIEDVAQFPLLGVK